MISFEPQYNLRFEIFDKIGNARLEQELGLISDDGLYFEIDEGVEK